ncbi:hypothetical protein FQN57_004335 [Myotisia sp. PD_48]|nr:hypothetical protein FQN57_004335 [Myotisia sp. PD_48]
MITGVETAGLVLGSVPLIVAALEFYRAGVKTCLRYRRYRSELKDLSSNIQTEKTIYYNTIGMLLSGIIPDQALPEFLANPCGEQWSDRELDQALRARLAGSFDSYMGTIDQINTIMEDFKGKLKLNQSGKAQFQDLKRFREHYKRLKFSLRKSEYDELINKLRQANISLCRLTNQTISLENIRRSNTERLPAIPNFERIRNHARSFYSILCDSWKCSCQADHSISLELAAHRSPRKNTARGSKPVFSVVFRYNHENVQNQNQSVPPWTWLKVDAYLSKHRDTGSTMVHREGGPGIAGSDEQVKQPVSVAIHPLSKRIPPLSSSDIERVEDLCAAIAKLQQTGKPAGLSLVTAEGARHKYSSSLNFSSPTNQNPLSMSSLRSILKNRQFTRYRRLRFAVSLASSVLQLHGTPWMTETWDKDNIHFTGHQGSILLETAFVSTCFNQSGDQNQMPQSSSSWGGPVRNRTLFALGVTLIELWYGAFLHELREPQDYFGIPADPVSSSFMADWATADRIVNELYHEAGTKYSDAVRRCIRCDFDRRDHNLASIEFQAAVHLGVVVQLNEYLGFLS